MRPTQPKQPKGKRQPTEHQRDRKLAREAKAIEKRRQKFANRTPDSPYRESES